MNFKLLIIFTVLVTLINDLRAQIPNDICSGALSVFLNQNGESESIVADLEHAHPSYSGPNNCTYASNSTYEKDRWYKFVATGSLSRISTVASYARLSVYSGTCGQFEVIACNNEIFETEIGQEYYLRVMENTIQGFTIPSSSVTFTILSDMADSNLDCGNATSIILSEEVSIAGNFSDIWRSSFSRSILWYLWYIEQSYLHRWYCKNIGRSDSW